ncbi:hypothetical protein [Xanthomonas sp. NCPPB 2632]|uniref:hypothetical protein n=1 Tax=Xanthomonas sp. NCPPB 2632 TaxID=3240912 RepID=UPI003515C205
MRSSTGTIFVLAVFLTAALAFSSGTLAADGAVSHRLTVVNDRPDPIDSLAYTPSGADRWFSVVGGPIAPGKASQAVVSLPGSACVFDVRVRYAGQPAVLIKAWNACDMPVLHVRQPGPT